MKIISINIIEYASITNRVIDFSDSLNIIEGENESGKSTLLSFIKFMLYGLPRRSSGEVVSEKEKSFSWKNGVAAGTMTIKTAEGEYRIERSAREGTRGEKLVIVDLSDGSFVHKGEIPGELFLGVPLAVFESSACVKQLSCTSLDGGELGNALENLLLSADETLDTERAISKIEASRRKLLHKSKNAGSIYELTLKRDNLRTRLEEAKKKAVQIMDYEASFESLGAKCNEYRAELEKNRELCRAYENRQQLIRFESLNSAKARIESIETDIAALKAEKCHYGFVPDGEYQRAVALAEKDYLSAAEDYKIKKEIFDRAESKLIAEDYNPEHIAKIEERGGAKLASEGFGKIIKGAKKTKTFGIVFLALSILCLLPAAFGAGALWCSFTLLPPNFPSFLEILEKPTVALTVCSLTVLLLAFALVFLDASRKKRKKAKQICAEFDLDEKSTEDQMLSYFERCISSRDLCENRKEDHQRALNEKGNAELKLKKAEEELFILLGRAGIEADENSTSTEISAAVASLLASSEKVCRELSELERDLAKYRALYEERSREIEGLDENEIRSSLSGEIIEKLGSVNITMLRREYEFLKSKTESAEQKKYFYDRELIGLRATAEDPFKGEALLRETEAKLAKEKELHDALSLASDAIREAAESMRKNVTPRVRARAGEIMGILTKGKYRALGITPEFSITVETEGVRRPIEALSAGTRDAAYLSLRLALISVLYRKEQPPLLLDEVLSQIDDSRASSVLSMLREYCGEGTQCLLFTCHTREAAMAEANVVRMGDQNAKV